MGRLPDKGEKIRALAERIKEAVRGREKVDQTADLFEKMSLDADRSRQLPPAGENTHHDEEMEILGAIINREVCNSKLTICITFIYLLNFLYRVQRIYDCVKGAEKNERLSPQITPR